jgi:hypothetical protein
MLLHVSVYDHHQGAYKYIWTYLKLQLLKCSVKIRRYKLGSGMGAYYVVVNQGIYI